MAKATDSRNPSGSHPLSRRTFATGMVATTMAAPLATPALAAPNRIAAMIAEFHRLDDEARFCGDPANMIRAADRVRARMLNERPADLGEAISQIRFIEQELDEGMYDDFQQAGLRNALAFLESVA